METQVGHIYEPALIIWKSLHWKTVLQKGRRSAPDTAVVFLQVTASVAANDKPNFRWFLPWLQTLSAEVCDSLLVGKE